MAARYCTHFSCSELSVFAGWQLDSQPFSVVLFVCHLAAMDESSAIAGCDNRAIFVALLKYYTVVLNKSMLPKIASDKENAWACFAAQFSKSVGKQTSVPQMKKTFKQYEISCKKKMMSTQLETKQ